MGLAQLEGRARPRPGLVDLQDRQSGRAGGGSVPVVRRPRRDRDRSPLCRGSTAHTFALKRGFIATSTPTQIAQPTATATPTPSRIHALASVPPAGPLPALRLHRTRHSRTGGQPGPYQRQRPCRLHPDPVRRLGHGPRPLRRAEPLGHPVPHDRGPSGDDTCRWRHLAGARRGA